MHSQLNKTDEQRCGALKSADLLKELNCSRSTFQTMLADNSFPPADLVVGKTGKRWTRQLFETWLLERTGPRTPGRPRGGSGSEE